jgi:hypothetical protein
MSEQDVFKAELKARRSSRRLEQGLEHLSVKLGEGIARVNRARGPALLTLATVGALVAGFLAGRGSRKVLALKGAEERPWVPVAAEAIRFKKLSA